MRARCEIVLRGLLVPPCLAAGVACTPDPGDGDPVVGDASTAGETTTGAPATSSGEGSGAAGTGGAETSGGVGGVDSTGAPGGSNGTFNPGGGPLPEPCPAGVPPSLEVGYGHGEFHPLASGPATLVMGPQGGFHVELGLRASGLDVADWASVHFVATTAAGTVADHDAVAVFSCLDGRAPVVAEALWVNVVFDVGPDALLDEIVTIEVEVEDWTGVVVSDTIEVSIESLT